MNYFEVIEYDDSSLSGNSHEFRILQSLFFDLLGNWDASILEASHTLDLAYNPDHYGFYAFHEVRKMIIDPKPYNRIVQIDYLYCEIIIVGHKGHSYKYNYRNVSRLLALFKRLGIKPEIDKIMSGYIIFWVYMGEVLC